MPIIGENSAPKHAERASDTLGDLLSSSQGDMPESIGRANKGELFVLRFLAMHSAPARPSGLSAALCASTARISAVLGTLEKGANQPGYR